MKQKLIRLESELDAIIKQDYDLVIALQGEPLKGNKKGERNLKTLDNLKVRGDNKLKEIEDQKNKIRMQENLANNYRKNGDIDNKNIANIDKLKEKNNAYSKKSLNNLLAIKEIADKQVITPAIQKLIDEKKLIQWVKQPIFFFVKGFNKIAMVIVNGELAFSKKYPPQIGEVDKIREFLDL